MRVLYLITRADLGGAQVHLLDLLERLREEVDAVAAAGEEGYFTERVRALGVPCHVLPDLVQPVAPGRDLRALWQVGRLIRRVRPDLVHAHTSKAGFLGRCAAWLAGVPAVYTAHTWCFAEGASWTWSLAGTPAERLAAGWCGAIVNVSEANRELARRRRIAPPDRLVVIHNGIADTPHRAEPERPGVPAVAMVARFCEQKDQRLLLRVLAETQLPVRAMFIGDGPTRAAVQAEAGRLGLGARVQFLGERRDVAKLLSGVQIFALASRWEGFPISILEAMRAGLPVAASNAGGVAEAVEHGVTGFLVPCGDAAALRACLELLLRDPALRKRLGDAGRRRYEAGFTLDRMARRTFDAYQKVLREAREAGRLPSPSGCSPSVHP